MNVSYSSQYFTDIKDALERMIVTDAKGNTLDKDQAFEEWIDESEQRKQRRGVFFFCGNGASATMAEHMSHDCFQNADFQTYTVSETSHITAISNDISYEEVFSYRIGKMLTDKDMVIAISSSGNSPNIVKAIDKANEIGCYVVSVSGKKEDNKIRKMGNLNFYVPLFTYGMVESAHAVLLHSWIDRYQDKYLEGRR